MIIKCDNNILGNVLLLKQCIPKYLQIKADDIYHLFSKGSRKRDKQEDISVGGCLNGCMEQRNEETEGQVLAEQMDKLMGE